MNIKNIIYFLILILFSCSGDQEKWHDANRILSIYNADGKLNYSIEQTWDMEQWLNREKKVFGYDLVGNENMILTLSWRNNDWQNQQLDSIVYASNGKVLLTINERWRDNKWYQSTKEIYSYDDELNLEQITNYQNFDSGWVEISKEFKDYSDLGIEVGSSVQYRKSYINEKGNYIFTDWQDVLLRVVNIIDSSQNIIEKQVITKENETWKMAERTTFTYNFKNQIVLNSSQKTINDSLENDEKTEIIYNKFGKETEVSSTWKNNSWVSFNQHLFLYDEQGLLTEMVYQEWNNEIWINMYRTIYKYDTHGNEIERIVQKYFE